MDLVHIFWIALVEFIEGSAGLLRTFLSGLSRAIGSRRHVGCPTSLTNCALIKRKRQNDMIASYQGMREATRGNLDDSRRVE